MKLSPDAVRTLLTSVFPSEFIDDGARECGVVGRDRDIDIRMLVWTLAVGFAVGGETRSIADYRRAYNAATNQSAVASSFYDRFTESLQNSSPNSLNTHSARVQSLITSPLEVRVDNAYLLAVVFVHPLWYE